MDKLSKGLERLITKVDKNGNAMNAIGCTQRKGQDSLEIAVDKINVDNAVRFKKWAQLDAMTHAWLTEYKFYKEKRSSLD